MEYAYSARNNAFYPYSLREAYIASGTWPDDGVIVGEEIFLEYTNPPAGKIRIAGKDGLPAWADIPPPTHEQQVATAEAQRNSLLAEANAVTADWRTELALGIISGEDKAKLISWMQYIKTVKAVDTSTAPEVIWPAAPAQ
ncbi:TPA: tail fiber assembly protein [Escherichia coli]